MQQAPRSSRHRIKTPRPRGVSILRVGLLAGGFLLAGARAGATTIDLSWDACAPITAHRNSAGPQSYSILVTASGQDEGHKGYAFRLDFFVTEQSRAPDAWRFDDAGCQGPGLILLRTLGSGSKACPPMQGTLPALQIKQVDYNSLVGLMGIVIANDYPNGGLGNTTQVDPDARYLLGRIDFDHTYSVNGPGTPGESCGGFETNVNFRLYVRDRWPYWRDLSGTERPFTLGQSTLTFCGTGCPVPATNSTWGQLKGQYRR